MLRKELNIQTFEDLLWHFPFRHIDKTRISTIAAALQETDYVLIKGNIRYIELFGERHTKRLTADVTDATGTIELIWFQGIARMQEILQEGRTYIVWGKLSQFNGKPQISHPEIELFEAETGTKKYLEPVYPSTEKLKSRGLNNRAIGKLTSALLAQIHEKEIIEILPLNIIQDLKLNGRYQSIVNMHFPPSANDFAAAQKRLKFEELFLAQLKMLSIKNNRKLASRGFVFEKVGQYFTNFYNQYMPFELTGAQKKVIREIRNDTATGHQMNRLLQGDVGSGKTVVALIIMLIAADNHFQSCLMAPTEILAVQHFQSLKELLEEMPLNIALLTGNTKSAERKKILRDLLEGNIHLLIGTHSLIEDTVQFKNLGLAIIDEQHRFGVEQRGKLWKKNNPPPHVLVMTATPIPRTLAMSIYGDLDYSVIDELPPGRKPIQTVHRFDNKRAGVMDFIKEEIAKGRQAYIIYPLIEESEKLDYENLMAGYELVKTFFPEHLFNISMVHGRMKQDQKNTNMQRFVSNDTHIMVSTTVIEVGVNVPNASVMVIESAEKFGLSTLHQLRGRVGRGSDNSYCILLTPYQISKDAKQRMSVMTSTTDGFVIAEKDMELRGPGDMEGTRQSGALNFKLASIVHDKELLELAKKYADMLIISDPGLQSEVHTNLHQYLSKYVNLNQFGHIS